LLERQRILAASAPSRRALLIYEVTEKEKILATDEEKSFNHESHRAGEPQPKGLFAE
jgi:hypothetical protein